MGIDLNLLDLQCGARILYKANADHIFAEYELDYIIFAKVKLGEFKVNSDEVRKFEFVSLKDIDSFLEERESFGEF